MLFTVACGTLLRVSSKRGMTRVFAYVCEPWSDSGRGMTWYTRFAFGMGVFGARMTCFV